MKIGDKVWINYCNIDGIEGSDSITCEGIIVSYKPNHSYDEYIVEYRDEYYPYDLIQKRFSSGFLTKID